MALSNIHKEFFALIKAGLWGTEAKLSAYGNIDYDAIYRLAEEQSVVGLITAGLENVQDVKVPQLDLLTFIGATLQIEQRNKEMDLFIERLICLLRENDIYTLLVKGQGIAQCYERPLWRASGDVDLLLNEQSYDKAKSILLPLATNVETEYTHFKHQSMTIDSWEVELHGTLHSRLSNRVERVIDQAQRDVFYGGKVRSWMDGKTQVFLPAPDSDVIFVFTHILHHFFFEGIGMRQLCDWCRLLWKYRTELNTKLLEKRLRDAGLMTEWWSFASYAVEYLGMPVDAMPFYSENTKWSKKAAKISSFILEVGNFGHNQHRNYKGMSYSKRKFVSFWERLRDMLRHFTIFPKDSIVFFGGVLRSGLYAAVRGE